MELIFTPYMSVRHIPNRGVPDYSHFSTFLTKPPELPES